MVFLAFQSHSARKKQASAVVVKKTQIKEKKTNKTNKEIDQQLAMVQLLGRLSMSLGILIVSGLGGWLANIMSYQNLFLLTLLIPFISISGCSFFIPSNNLSLSFLSLLFSTFLDL